MIIKNPILLPKAENLLLNPNSQNYPLMENATLKIVAERLPEKVVSLISDSRRKGTFNQYELVGRKWDIWCREWAYSSICCSLNPVLEVFTELFSRRTRAQHYLLLQVCNFCIP